jgi:hydrogenase maturation factor HypF (carbamoyltransferase family)
MDEAVNRVRRLEKSALKGDSEAIKKVARLAKDILFHFNLDKIGNQKVLVERNHGNC